MTTHTLALVVLGLLIANEGRGISEVSRKPFKWEPKHIITTPLTVFVWWLVITTAF